MNDQEYDEFEQDLRRVRPAAAPAEVVQRLVAARPARRSPRPMQIQPAPFWSMFLRWLVPATAVVIIAIAVWRWPLPRDLKLASPPIAEVAPAVKADNVELDQELVRSFDTVARLPTGEPVRFRCREWMDEVILRDTARNLIIEQRTPRVEVIPVRFETY